MYGAILGDIIGSRFEFSRNIPGKDFELLTDRSRFTDDTVLTIAIGEALLEAGKNADAAQIRQHSIKSMLRWGQKYPDAGYGGSFIAWLISDHPAPYGSFGNGSAMRVSAAGWLFNTVERTREAARATAQVTHNHTEGIKGAECTAAVIFLARTGRSKEDIRSYVEREFGYDLSLSLEQLCRLRNHPISCQDSLPKALKCFLLSNSYEETVRTAVSLGGDTDTVAAIAGSMAEAMYGIPVSLFAAGRALLPEEMKAVLTRFDSAIGRGRPASYEDRYADNRFIKMAVEKVRSSRTSEAYLTLLGVLSKRMQEEGEAPTPMVDVNHAAAIDPDKLCVGSSFSFDRDIRLQFETMTDSGGNQWFPLFTDMEELHKGVTTNFIINASIRVILENGLHSDRVKGVVINPFGEALALPKELLQILMKHAPSEE